MSDQALVAASGDVSALVSACVERYGRTDGLANNAGSPGGGQGAVHVVPDPVSEHGVVGFSKALGPELARTGVTANAVCPGFPEAPVAEQVHEHYSGIWKPDEGAVHPRVTSRVPIVRYVDPY